MVNLFDYISWRGDLEFDQVPFNPVDNLIFSQLSYLVMDGIVPEPDRQGSVSLEEVARRTAKIDVKSSALKDITVTNANSVAGAIKNASRFKNCELFGYVNRTVLSEEIQFSAFCAIIGKNSSSKKMLVVFRGTDTSLAGWMEDFNMTFINSVPSQKESVLYLEKMAASFPYPLIVAGHSKGGNLAIYASTFCDKAVQNRITDVYSNDAPGFHREVIESDGYKTIRGRIRAFVPQSSFVGMLFKHGVPPTVVKSSAIGFLQHDICSWEVMGGNLAGSELTPHSRFVNNLVSEWVEKIGEERWQKVIEALYKILMSTNATSLLELGTDWRKAASVMNGIKNIDGPTKKIIFHIAAEFYKIAGKSIIGQRKKK